LATKELSLLLLTTVLLKEFWNSSGMFAQGWECFSS